MLSNKLITDFVNVVAKKDDKKEGTTVMGTVQEYGGKLYVKIDGSNQLTSADTTANIKVGDRVTVLIKNHSATITGNITSPSANSEDLSKVEDTVKDAVDQITEFEIIVADKASFKELEVERARIDNLVSENVTITGNLEAANAEIENLKAQNVVIEGSLDAVEADIENLHATKLDVDIADIKFATIENLEALNAYIRNLEADYGEFKNLTTENFVAVNAKIENLDADKISADEADLKYANIDFANIGSAAIENFFAKSGMIGDLVVGDGTVTGTLVGVTIKGELIEGGTVVADKLVLKGEDGLYYKLNFDGETIAGEQTDYNSINGKIITAKSIVAEKISVDDLVAFDATIGGFTITENSLYSGVKSSATNSTLGVYLDKDGQFSVGDSVNFFRYYRQEDGSYRLELSASSIKFSTSDTNLNEVIVDSIEEFYISESRDELIGGEWSSTPPTDYANKYIFRRTKLKYADNTIRYSPSEYGICITGNDGEDGYITSATEPENKQDNMLWCDISGEPPLLKEWDGKKWNVVNDTSEIIQQVYDDIYTSIEQKADEIKLEVSETTYSKEETEQFITELSSSITQTKEDITFQFTGMQQEIDDTSKNLDDYKNLVDSYIQFSADGITLGERDSPFTAVLSKDRLSFIQSGSEIAYLSNNKLYITNAEVLDRFTVGNQTSGYFDWIPRSNGNLGMKWRN